MANNKVVFGNTTIMDITDTTAEASDVAQGEVFYNRAGVRSVGTGNYMDIISNPTADDILIDDGNGQAVDSGVSINDVALSADLPGQATDTTLGLVKINPAQSVTLNADGQLEVGGRLGQFPNGGVYYPTDRNFVNVGNYTFAITDAQNMFFGNREFAIAGGLNQTLKTSAAAGSTVYQVSNSYANRIALSNMVGGVATRQESTAGTFTVPIVSIKFANGNDVTPYSGGTESNNNIIITTDGSANPSDATTQIRLYGKFSGTDIISAGQGNASSGGKTLQVGQSCQNAGSSQVIQVGNAIYSSANNSAQFGRQHINKQTDSLLAGYGHDNSNGSQGASALGLWSSIDSNTAFAVGNGTAVTARSNAFEVTKDGGIVLKAPNGTRYKITVSNTGALTTTAL